MHRVNKQDERNRGIVMSIINASGDFHRFVQLLNPRSGKYVKIDRLKGVVVSTKRTYGPYKGVLIIDRLEEF